MTKAEKWAKRYAELQQRARSIQARADEEIVKLSSEWPTLRMRDSSFVLTSKGTIAPSFERKWPTELNPEESLQLAYWMIDIFSEGDA